MAYVLISDGVVVQKQPDEQDGFIEAPEEVVCGWLYDGMVFAAPYLAPTLPELKAAKIAQAREICQANILGGFLSSGLGTPHRYPSQMTDQINLMGSVTASLLPDLPAGWSTPFWCANEADVWEMRPHTAAQIQTVGSDGKAHVLACQQRLDALTLDISMADDAAALDAVDISTGW